MYCPYCGKEVPKGAKFCSFCGKEVTIPKEELQPEADNPNLVKNIQESLDKPGYVLRIVREAQWFAVNPPMKITIDGRDKYNLENGKSLELSLPAGKHTINIKITIRNRTIDFDLQEDTRIDLSMNKVTGEIDVALSSVSAEAGQEDTAEETIQSSAPHISRTSKTTYCTKSNGKIIWLCVAVFVVVAIVVGIFLFSALNSHTVYGHCGVYTSEDTDMVLILADGKTFTGSADREDYIYLYLYDSFSSYVAEIVGKYDNKSNSLASKSGAMINLVNSSTTRYDLIFPNDSNSLKVSLADVYATYTFKRVSKDVVSFMQENPHEFGRDTIYYNYTRADNEVDFNADTTINDDNYSIVVDPSTLQSSISFPENTPVLEESQNKILSYDWIYKEWTVPHMASQRLEIYEINGGLELYVMDFFSFDMGLSSEPTCLLDGAVVYHDKTLADGSMVFTGNGCELLYDGNQITLTVNGETTNYINL